MIVSQIIGVIVILSIVFMAIYCIKGYNMTVGFYIMSAIWIVLALIGNIFEPNTAIGDQSIVGVLGSVFQDGAETYGKSVLVNVIFGSFFGTVLIETGIASTLIRKTVELGGDRPQLTMILLSLVTTVLFTSLTGVGPYIAIGVIILPIYLALGIPKLIAAFVFIASAGVSASLLNVVNFKQYATIFSTANERFANYTFEEYFPFAIIAAVISLLAVWIIACVKLKKQKTSYSWAAPAEKKASGNVPAISLLTVILPVLLIIVFKVPVILAFILSSLYALLTTGAFKDGFVESSRKIVKYATDGTISIAPMVAFLMAIATYNASAAYIAPYLGALIGNFIPHSALVLCIMFGVLAIFGHFRGPMNLVGSGVALLHVIAATTTFPVQFLYPLFAVTTIIPQGLDITLSGAVWSLDYTKVQSKDYMKLAMPTSWVLCMIMCIVVYFMFGNVVG